MSRLSNRFVAASVGSIVLFACGCGRPSSNLHWSRLPAMPDAEGFAGSFAGVSGGALLVAGGANFPDRKPWDGGKKIWYDAVFVLESWRGSWRIAGRLPRPNAYGLSVQGPEGVVCIGGGDEQRHVDEVVLLRWEAGGLKTDAWPRLPRPSAFMCGAVAGGRVYLAGGTESPEATACLDAFWSLELNSPEAGWKELPPCPGPPRMLGVAGAAGGDFFLFSGTKLSPGADGKPIREYLRDAWRYSPARGWSQLPDLPRAAVAAPSPAPLCPGGRLLVISGDDGGHVGFQPPAEHPGFPRSVMAYDLARDSWEIAGETPLSRATAPVVEWGGGYVIPSGEVQPGRRSPEVWRLSCK